MKKSAAGVQQALERHGLDCRVVELPASTRTARDAAAAIGCSIAQIAKTIVFRKTGQDHAVLAIVGGISRVDENKIAALAGSPVEQANPGFVRKATGFAIGGVPPVGHTTPIRTFIDGKLFEHAEIWAAAGTPNAVFQLTPAELQLISGGTVGAIATKR